MTDNPFDIYTHTVCASNGDEIPGWLFCAICALPFVLIAIDILDR